MTNPHEPDLLLARACLKGDSAALATLEREILAKLGPLIGRVDSNQAFVDEVVQHLRVALLVGEKGGPKLETYVGRGPLAAWVNIVALRIALGLKRGSSKEHLMGDENLEQRGDFEDPELRIVRESHREDFQQAFRVSLASLSTRERNVLRLRYIDRLNIDQIGGIYRVHRATVARWIAAAREKIVAKTRDQLRSKLALTTSQLDSLFRVVNSDLDLSVSLIIADATGDETDREDAG